jgi:hypothetical protein
MIARLRRRHRRMTRALFLLLALMAWYRVTQPAIDVRVDSIPESSSANLSR